MQIQCTIKRKNGSRCTLGNTEYHFVPNDAGDHVCEVKNEDHIARFLSIPGYESYKTDKIPASVVKKMQAQKQAEIEAAENEADTGDDDEGTNESGDASPATSGEGDKDYSAMSEDELRVELKNRTGRSPNKNMKTENMIAKLKELDEEGGAD